MRGAPHYRFSLLLLLRTAVAGEDVWSWPDVLPPGAWLFDLSANYGFRLTGSGTARAPCNLGARHRSLRAAQGHEYKKLSELGMGPSKPGNNGFLGPAPDWALGSKALPSWHFQVDSPIGDGSWQSTSFPGVLSLNYEDSAVKVQANLTMVTKDTALVAVSMRNLGSSTVSVGINASAAAVNVTSPHALAVDFGMPPPQGPCYDPKLYGRGGVRAEQSWSVSSTESFFALAQEVTLLAKGSATAYFSITAASNADDESRVLQQPEKELEQSVARWNGYLSSALAPVTRPSERFVTVKAVQTLIYNWRFLPNSTRTSVLPSYTGYGSGSWSWDTYKQAVGMAIFAPEIAKDQLRSLVAAQNPANGHIPDKVSRCGVGGGCSGKPPLLSWSVEEVAKLTGDLSFEKELYPHIERFHHFWYKHRDVPGLGLCSWTEGMESGMDDGVRFVGAKSARNASTGVSALDFYSIDLNGYLYREKRVLARMAARMGNTTGAEHWSKEADALLPRLQIFYVPGSGSGSAFFEDVYYNGTAIGVQGCEGYTALFSGAAEPKQAVEVASSLAARFLTNFSMTTVSLDNKLFNARGYWKGPTWLDQSWFAYAGLMRYANGTEGQSLTGAERTQLRALAEDIRKRTLTVGGGFTAGDKTALNEHYNPLTGQPEGSTHFSWTAAHILMWTTGYPEF